MRSKILYLSVFVSCLIFGIFLPYFLQPTTNDAVEIPSVSHEEQGVKATENTVAAETVTDAAKEVELPSDEQSEKWQLDSLKPVIKAWQDGYDLEDQYFDLKRSDDWASWGERAATTGLLDADKDGQNELAVRTGCSAVGNCVFFLFKRQGKVYRILLQTDMVQRYRLLSTKSHGYYDLEATSHGSVNSGDMVIYRFNGKEYVAKKCYEYVYENYQTKSGLTLSRNKPTLTPERCMEY